MTRISPGRQVFRILMVLAVAMSASCSPSGDVVSASLTGSASITVADTRAADITGSWRLIALDGRSAPDPDGSSVIEIASGTMTVGRGCTRSVWRYTLIDARLTTTRQPGPDEACPEGRTPWHEAVSRFIDEAPIAALRDDGALVLAMDTRLAVFERAI